MTLICLHHQCYMEPIFWKALRHKVFIRRPCCPLGANRFGSVVAASVIPSTADATSGRIKSSLGSVRARIGTVKGKCIGRQHSRAGYVLFYPRCNGLRGAIKCQQYCSLVYNSSSWLGYNAGALHLQQKRRPCN